MSRDIHDMTRRYLLKTTALAAAGTTLGLLPAEQSSAAPAPAKQAKLGVLGEPVLRVEGALKVRGGARYAIDHAPENMVHGVIVQSTIPAGRIERIDSAAAAAAPGVIAVYTHESSLTIYPPTSNTKGGSATEIFTPLQDAAVRWNGQHVAMVVAETLEQASAAAALVRVDYAPGPAVLHPTDADAKPTPVDDIKFEWGDAKAALARAAVSVEGEYSTPREYHVPMELHACIAAWTNGELTVWESSQWVGGARKVISEWMGVPVAKVRVISPYVGGAFGCRFAPHPHVALACAASRRLQRPVKVALTRPQTFTGYGGRPRTSQRLAIGADKDGKLVSIVHESWNETAMDDLHIEPCNAVTGMVYACPNVSSTHSTIAVHTVNPGWLRAPGENPSTFALETAMDELSYKLGIDPVELRLRNYAQQDPKAKMPWTSRRLREAYAAGADTFGWAGRNPAPRATRAGRQLVGWGMAGASYPVRRTPAEARIVVHTDGLIEVQSGAIDMGTGTYTILAQTVAEVMQVPASHVKVRLGDTMLPRAPLAGGSQLANLLTAAVHKTAVAMRREILTIASSHPRSPLRGTAIDDLRLEDGSVKPRRGPSRALGIGQLLKLAGRARLAVTADTFKPGASEKDRDAADQTVTQILLPTEGGVSAHAWGAHFVEVHVDEDFGTIRVKRMISAFDSGRLYNPRLAESQWIGGMIMGIGQALLEQGHIDPRDGRIVNANLADYMVPVNADIASIQALSVGVPDMQASALGGKAVGELGIVGVAAAISNAVYHATGKRVRALPITIEKLI